MKLFNTLSRKLEEFKPLKDHKVGIYSCGPTVYDHIHIGNLSSFIAADSLHRTLVAGGYDVQHVMNFTDVDDKTIARSAEQFLDDDPMTALKNLTKKYSDIFLQDLQSVGVDTQSIQFVNATDKIDQMQNLIRQLYNKKIAYITEDGVYFSIQAYKESGKKYGQLTDVSVDSTSQARIRNDEYDKEAAHDFALWKLQTGKEPAWDFNLDGHQLSGRPGWHIECSAMSSDALGQPFDIHTGGVDLIFPHHENEIAQSTAGKPDDSYANYFVHNEHLLVEGRKMSKSLNNFFTLRDIIEKGYEPLAFRLMVLQGHYRHQSNFTWENLAAAQNRLNSFRSVAALRWQTVKNNRDSTVIVLKSVPAELVGIMSNDLDTPTALAYISKLFSQLEIILLDSNIANRYDNVDDFVAVLKTIDQLFGLDLMAVADITDQLKSLIQDRQKARQSQDWDKADAIRQELEKQGIGVRDTEQKAIWFRL
ncbi:MAG: cysteine--tRNA ligase [Candidatus Saccharimonadales bacterium]